MWCEFLLTAVCLLLVMVVASQGRLGMEGLQEWCSSNHVKVVENLSCQLGVVEVEVEVDGAVPSQPRDAPVPLLSQILTLCVSGAPVCQQCWDLLTVIHPGSNNWQQERWSSHSGPGQSARSSPSVLSPVLPRVCSTPRLTTSKLTRGQTDSSSSPVVQVGRVEWWNVSSYLLLSGGQFRRETLLPNGTVVGAYSWRDGRGLTRLYSYMADSRGYRVTQHLTSTTKTDQISPHVDNHLGSDNHDDDQDDNDVGRFSNSKKLRLRRKVLVKRQKSDRPRVSKSVLVGVKKLGLAAEIIPYQPTLLLRCRQILIISFSS